MYFYILDENGDPIATDDSLQWARWFEGADRRLHRDKLPGVTVSTVFLGLDHGFNDSRPVLWETALIWHEGDRDRFDIVDRYHTKAAATEGHKAWLARAQVRKLK